jgi:excisionase family DNA binding protein
VPVVDLVTTTEAASRLGISRTRVVALIDEGRLKAQKTGRDWMIKKGDLKPLKKRKPGRPRSSKQRDDGIPHLNGSTPPDSSEQAVVSNSESLQVNRTQSTGVTKTGRRWTVIQGDAATSLKGLEAKSFDSVITSPPYFWLRDYGVEGQIGREASIQAYIDAMLDVTAEVHHVLKTEGVFFLNIGDTYYSGKGESQGIDTKNRARRFGLRAVDKGGGMGLGLRGKTLIGIPWRLAIAMTQEGWILRSSIIWHRARSLTESVVDRPRRSYEFLFMFVKSRKYFFNRAGVRRESIVIRFQSQQQRCCRGTF